MSRKLLMMAILACLLALSGSINPGVGAQTTLKTGEISGLTVISNTDRCGGDVLCKTVYQDCGEWTDDKNYQITLKDESAKTTTDKVTDLKTTIKMGDAYCKTITVEGKKSEFTNVDNQLCKDGVCDDRFAWWNSTYPYRKCFSVTVPTGTLTNYQVLFPVTYSASMQTDFDDVRWVVNDSNLTEIDYWMPSYTASTSANFWVEVPVVNSTPCMYWGNAGVTTTSNGFNTFLIFDDFQDQNLTALTAWSTVSETGTCGYSTITSDGSFVLNITSYSNPGECGKYAGTIPTRSYIMEYDQLNDYDSGSASYPMRSGTYLDASNWFVINYARIDDDIDAGALVGAAFKGWTEITGTSNPLMELDAWYHTRVIMNESATKATVWLSSGRNNYTMNNNGAASSEWYDVNGSAMLRCVLLASCWYDNIFVREYNNPEPTITALSGETIYSTEIEIAHPVDSGIYTYGTPLYLNVSANSTIVTWYYDYNGTNTTFTPNVTLDLATGVYTLIVWGNDTVNGWWSDSVNFTIVQPIVYIENCTAEVMGLCQNDDYFLGFWGPEWSSGVCSGDTLYLSRNCSTSWAVGNITYYCNWDKTETRACANGCYDLLTYYGAGCAPTDFEIAIYSIAIFIAVLGLVLWIRKRG